MLPGRVTVPRNETSAQIADRGTQAELIRGADSEVPHHLPGLSTVDQLPPLG